MRNLTETIYLIDIPVDCAQKWLKALGKEQGRKGKRLFMPMRIALTVGPPLFSTPAHCLFGKLAW